MDLSVDVEKAIRSARGHKVLMDHDLAVLYGVSNKALKQAVRRNRTRFPDDFIFELTWKEALQIGRIQTPILHRGRNLKYRPLAFTEQGVAMLSSILKSPRAIRVNIEIMRAFVRLRRMLATHDELAKKLAVLERTYDAQFKVVFDAIRELMEPAPDPPKGRIGFHRP